MSRASDQSVSGELKADGASRLLCKHTSAYEVEDDTNEPHSACSWNVAFDPQVLL